MSMTIFWAPIGKGGTVACATPSSTIEALENALGRRPWTLGVEWISGLRFMQAADPRNQTYRELIALIEQHEEIRVWTE